MLLSSEDTTREVTCNIFELMELGMVKYHRVMQDAEGAPQDENNLANLETMWLRSQCRENDKELAAVPSPEASGGLQQGIVLPAVPLPEEVSKVG